MTPGESENLQEQTAHPYERQSKAARMQNIAGTHRFHRKLKLKTALIAALDMQTPAEEPAPIATYLENIQLKRITMSACGALQSKT